MKVGKIEQLTTTKHKDALSLALDQIRNPGGGVSLVSHGWRKRCEVCEKRAHAKWHECARGEINPVALIQWVESFTSQDAPLVKRIVGYVIAVTGMDEAKMRALLEEQQATPAVESVGESG